MNFIKPLGLTTSSQEMWRIEEHVKQHCKDAINEIQNVDYSIKLRTSFLKK